MVQNQIEIAGVEVKELVSYPDDRGFFREVIRETDPIFSRDSKGTKGAYGQWSHSKMALNTVKAWHFHHKQIDWWYCPIGVIHTVLIDMREESPTYKGKMEFLMGESELNPDARQIVVKIPQGVAHGCKVLTPFAHLFYITSEIYNPQDEGRYPFDSKEMGHDWGSGEWIISEKDRKLFIPPHPRVG